MKPKMEIDKMNEKRLKILPLWLDYGGDYEYERLLVFKSRLPNNMIMELFSYIEHEVKEEDEEWDIDMIIKRFYNQNEIERVDWENPSEYANGVVV